jgi:hypothetical protein
MEREADLLPKFHCHFVLLARLGPVHPERESQPTIAIFATPSVQTAKQITSLASTAFHERD